MSTLRIFVPRAPVSRLARALAAIIHALWWTPRVYRARYHGGRRHWWSTPNLTLARLARAAGALLVALWWSARFRISGLWWSDPIYRARRDSRRARASISAALPRPGWHQIRIVSVRHLTRWNQNNYRLRSAIRKDVALLAARVDALSASQLRQRHDYDALRRSHAFISARADELQSATALSMKIAVLEDRAEYHSGSLDALVASSSKHRDRVADLKLELAGQVDDAGHFARETNNAIAKLTDRLDGYVGQSAFLVRYTQLDERISNLVGDLDPHAIDQRLDAHDEAIARLARIDHARIVTIEKRLNNLSLEAERVPDLVNDAAVLSRALDDATKRLDALDEGRANCAIVQSRLLDSVGTARVERVDLVKRIDAVEASAAGSSTGLEALMELLNEHDAGENVHDAAFSEHDGNDDAHQYILSEINDVEHAAEDHNQWGEHLGDAEEVDSHVHELVQQKIGDRLEALEAVAAGTCNDAGEQADDASDESTGSVDQVDIVERLEALEGSVDLVHAATNR